MKKTFFTFLLFLFANNYLSAQKFDTKTYSDLVKANKEEFVTIAGAAGLKTDFDETSKVLFAGSKECLYSKPLSDTSNNEYYDLVLIVSTLDKTNNKLILKNAQENAEKKGTWTDSNYLYIEWDMENPQTKEMWHRVLIYKKKK